MPTSTEKRRIVVAAAVVLTGIGLVGVAFAPALLTYSPLLLIALSAIPRHLVLAAPITDPFEFIAVASARRVVGCVLLYYVGESFGESGLEWLSKRYPKARRLVKGINWVFERAGALVVVAVPIVMSPLAGNARMPMWQFLPAVTLGQIIWVSVTYWVGDFLGTWTKPFLAWLGQNVISTTIACIVCVAAYQLIRRYRQGKRAGDAIHPTEL